MRDFKKLSKRRQARITKRAKELGVTVEAFRKERQKKIARALKNLAGALVGLSPTEVDDKIAKVIENIDEVYDAE